LLTSTAIFLLKFAAYLLIARACLAIKNYGWKTSLFALTNLVGVAILFDWSAAGGRAIVFLVAYIVMVCFLYLTMRLFAKRTNWLSWVAFLAPIAALIVIRYAPFLWNIIWRVLHLNPDRPVAAFFIGISFMAFRLSHLALEVKSKTVPKATFWEYLGFAFFVPTLVVGPINPYSTHHTSLNKLDRAVTPIGRSILRIIVGVAKFQFLASIFNQLSYSGLILDGHPHGLFDLAVASVAYYLYLYCNFSGFCDMAIGTAGLMGIHVKENFNFPLAANSVKDYWNRWHITLSGYMRDLVFWRLSKYLSKRFGAKNSNHAIALSTFVVFLLIGAWHGLGWHYQIFGVMHAIGVVGNHYYTIWLKKRLGAQRFKAYNESRVVAAVTIALTFIFVTISMFFFANDLDTARKILAAIN
jgi:D-alanyl-lipoteichoic acid acyltransferase DltB (MBOAT superfamily)